MRLRKLLVVVVVSAWVGSTIGTTISVATAPGVSRQISELQQRVSVLEHDHHLFCTVVINQTLSPATMRSVGC